MSDVAVRCEGLGKQYRVGERERYKALRDTLTDVMYAPARRLRSLLKGGANGTSTNGHERTFWALKDVSFEIKHGEVVGIIGRNGAGKSTLLKILSRITRPTEGYVNIRGRVGSLLEVGTGFHPELTGRENIYLNGAVLGMRRAEIQRKFDEIVAFAETEQFIDTPVKRYSSGMYVRLAFAVAAHLEPEVLVVDEVLAVGDASFQKKCLAKLENVGQAGRTVFFVSHNIQSIQRLCQRAILLDGGRVMSDGPAHEVTGRYLSSGTHSRAVREWADVRNAPGDEAVRLRAVRVKTDEGEVAETFDIRSAVNIEVEFNVLEPGVVIVPNVHFYTQDGVCAFVLFDNDAGWKQRPRDCGTYRSRVRVPQNYLSEGGMVLGAALSTMDPLTVHCHVCDVVTFQVIDKLEGDSARGEFAGHVPGVVRPMLLWSTEYAPEALP